jgi:hypothetical protein
MKLFFYKPKCFDPIILLIIKITSDDELEKVEGWAHELFQILMDQKEANEENILILSIIKDHDKATVNLIVPSTKSNQNVVNRCYTDTNFVNKVVVKTLIKSDTEFYIEIGESKVYIHSVNLNLMAFSKYYKIKK